MCSNAWNGCNESLYRVPTTCTTRRGALNREKREGVAEATVYVNFPLEGERGSRRDGPTISCSLVSVRANAHVSSWKYRCYGSNRQSSVWNIFACKRVRRVTGNLVISTLVIQLPMALFLSPSLSLYLSIYLSTYFSLSLSLSLPPSLSVSISLFLFFFALFLSALLIIDLYFNFASSCTNQLSIFAKYEQLLEYEKDFLIEFCIN